MKTLEEIKNEFARELSYNSWSEFRMINNRNIVYIEGAMDEVAKRMDLIEHKIYILGQKYIQEIDNTIKKSKKISKKQK